ncbi:zf-HC2 domain-containing protein [candidate division KSB1 bacterium]|nr:zf-HC2 domain-containing protein [candidate division KSB1 bacterium]
MSTCSKYQKKLVLYFYEELNEVEKADFEAHLMVCPACQSTLKQMQLMTEKIPANPLISPSNTLLTTFRKPVFQQTANSIANYSRPKWSPFSFLNPGPVFQFAFAIALVLIGFFANDFLKSKPKQPSADKIIQQLLGASQPIQLSGGQLLPGLANIEKVKYNPQDGTIEISYQTVNDIKLESDFSHPAIQPLLEYSLLEGTNPGVKLHTIKALNGIIRKGVPLNNEIIEALIALLKFEKNTGIRLQVIEVLSSLPLTDAIKDTFLKILVSDSNSALRIAIFRALIESSIQPIEYEQFLKAAEQDTNNYIRYHASRIIEQLTKNESHQSTLKNANEIMRKE